MPPTVQAALRRLEEHEDRDDERARADDRRFEKIETTITAMGQSLETKITKAIGDIQLQINPLIADKVRAEGKAEGIKEAVGAYEKKLTPNPWLLAIAPVFAALILGAFVSWLARDRVQGPIGSGERTTTTTSIPAGSVAALPNPASIPQVPLPLSQGQ